MNENIWLIVYLAICIAASAAVWRVPAGRGLTALSAVSGLLAAIGFLTLPITDRPAVFPWAVRLSRTLRPWTEYAGFPIREDACLWIVGLLLLLPLLIVIFRLMPEGAQAKAPGKPPANGIKKS